MIRTIALPAWMEYGCQYERSVESECCQIGRYGPRETDAERGACALCDRIGPQSTMSALFELLEYVERI